MVKKLERMVKIALPLVLVASATYVGNSFRNAFMNYDEESIRPSENYLQGLREKGM